MHFLIFFFLHYAINCLMKNSSSHQKRHDSKRYVEVFSTKPCPRLQGSVLKLFKGHFLAITYIYFNFSCTQNFNFNSKSNYDENKALTDVRLEIQIFFSRYFVISKILYFFLFFKSFKIIFIKFNRSIIHHHHHKT